MAPRSPPPPPHPPPPYVEMHVVTRRLLDVTKDVSSGTNAKSTESKVSSQTRVSQTVATRVARFFGMTKVSSTLLGLHFLVFFIAACSFRADACLIDAEDSAMRCAALDGELAPSFNAFEDEDEDETEDEEQFLLRRGNRDENRLYLLLPRRTPTQRATLPGKTSQSRNFGNDDDDDDDDVNSNSSNTSDDDCSLFAPLTWSNSENFTSLEWFRYFVFRYALEVALIFVFAAGASSRDLTHLGYLLLTLTFLRIRDLVMVKGDNLWRWLRWYNLFAITSACAWTLWFGTSDLMRGTGIDTSDQTAYSTGGCSAARVVGVTSTAGSLLPDLLIFVVARVTQVVIASETHKAVVLMEREARALGRANAETGKQKWLAGALSRRVRLAREREERRRRAEDVRAHVEQLSKEVLDLEHNAAPVEPMSPVHKHATYDAHDNARSYASESSFVSAGEENKDAKETEISEEDKLDAKPGPENPSTRQTSPENPNKGPVTTYGERLLHTLRGEVADPSSTLGLVIGGLTTITPWLAAPNSSACYFFFFAAFAFDFSAATLLYPTSLTLYALLAPRKPSLKFWSSMLMYSEGVLLTGFLLAIPCASGCFASRNCLSSSSSAGVVVNGANWVNAPVFFAYLATLFHRSALLRNGEMDDTFRALERSGDGVHGRSAENGRGARDGNSRTGNEDGTTSGIDSPTEDTFVDKIQAFVAAVEAFFQKVFTETSERDPSFVAVAVTTIEKGEPFSSSDETGNGNDGVSWEEVAVALNVVLHEHYRSVGTSRSADATDTACAKNPPFLKLVESDPHTRKQFARSFLADENENPAAKTPRKAAIFAVTAPAQALTPAADIARVLQTAQLRNCLRDDDVVRNEPNKVPKSFPNLVAVISFHRGGRDFYAPTCAVDFASFLFVLCFYQATVHFDTRGEALAETYHQGLFPIDYVLAVTGCAMLLIVDRVLYLHRWHVGKVVYHFLSYVFFVTVAFRLFHRHGVLQPTEQGRTWLLRVFFLLKSTSFALNARQLRSGYRGAGVLSTPRGVCSRSNDAFVTDRTEDEGDASFDKGAADTKKGGIQHTDTKQGTKPLSRLGPLSLIDDDGGGGGGGAPTTRTDFLTYVGYSLYLAVPFLYELRVLLDYTCLDSSLDLHDWLKLENITRDLFKTNVRNQNYFRVKQFGTPQPRFKKVFQQGGGVFLCLVLLIVAPFFIFSTSNPQVGINPVFGVSVNVTISSASVGGARGAFSGASVSSVGVFSASSGAFNASSSESSHGGSSSSVVRTATYLLFQGGSRVSFETPTEWRSLKTSGDDPHQKPPVQNPKQVQQVCVAPDSDKTWSLPPPVLREFNATVLRVGSLITVQWAFTRHLPVNNRVVFARSESVTLDDALVAQFKKALARSFVDTSGDDGTSHDKRDEDSRKASNSITLPSLYPRVWQLPGNGDPKGNYTTNARVDCVLSLRDDKPGTDDKNNNNNAPVTHWWGLRCGAFDDTDDAGSIPDEASTDDKKNSNKDTRLSSKSFSYPCVSTGSGPEVVLVSALVATGALASFSKLVGGVTGMYLVYVLAVGSFARSLSTNLVHKIPFNDLPSTRRIGRLIEDIYAMRRSREFHVEEKLFWLLIRIYRSPQVLFEFSRGRDGAAEPERPVQGKGVSGHGSFGKAGEGNGGKNDAVRRRGGWTSGDFF